MQPVARWQLKPFAFSSSELSKFRRSQYDFFCEEILAKSSSLLNVVGALTA